MANRKMLLMLVRYSFQLLFLVSFDGLLFSLHRGEEIVEQTTT